MKFKDAFSLTLNRKVTLEEINDWYKNDKNFFENQISGNLLCPKCKKAYLKYNNAKRPYLSCYPQATHSDNCSLKQEEYSKRGIDKLIKSQANNGIIIRQVESVFTNLFKTNDKANTNHVQIKKEQKENNKSQNQINKKHIKRIKRKNINTKITNDDFDTYKIFYGTVNCQKTEHKKKDDIHYYLSLSDKNNPLIFKIIVSENVYKYLSEEVKMNNNFNCNIALFAKLTNKKQGAKAVLIHSNFLKIHIL